MHMLLSTPLHQRAASRVQHPNHVAANSLSPQVARKGSTLSGFVQRSRLEREVGRDLHSNKWEEVWSCIRQSGHSGDGCRGSPMETRYETRSGDLFVRSWARVRRVSLDRRSSAGVPPHGGTHHAHMYSDQGYSSVFVNWTKQVSLQMRLKWWQWWGTH